MATILQQVWVHLEEPAPRRNVNVSTFLARCFCLTSLVLLGLQREVTKLSLEFKQRCWPSAKSPTLSRGRISGYWVDPCCVSLLRKNDLLHCLPSAVDQGQECGRNIQTLFCVVSNALMACDGNNLPCYKQNIKQESKGLFSREEDIRWSLYAWNSYL